MIWLKRSNALLKSVLLFIWQSCSSSWQMSEMDSSILAQKLFKRELHPDLSWVCLGSEISSSLISGGCDLRTRLDSYLAMPSLTEEVWMCFIPPFELLLDFGRGWCLMVSRYLIWCFLVSQAALLVRSSVVVGCQLWECIKQPTFRCVLSLLVFWFHGFPFKNLILWLVILKKCICIFKRGYSQRT